MTNLDDLSGLVSGQLKDQVEKVEAFKAARECLAPEVKDEVLDAFVEHYKAQSALPLKDRKLFKDKFGVFVIVMTFPEEETNQEYAYSSNWRNTGSDKKPNYYWFGPTIPLLATNKCTVFSPSCFNKYGFSAAIRCKITEEYKLMSDADHQKAFGTWEMKDGKQVKLLKKAWSVSEAIFEKKVGKLEDHQFEYTTKYTVNIIEVIQTLKSVVK